MVVQLAEIPWPRDRTRRGRTKGSRGAGSKPGPVTGVRAGETPATVAQELATAVRIVVEAEPAAAVETVLATAAFPVAVAAARAVPAHSAAAPAGTAEAARAAAAHAVHPAWEVPAAVADPGAVVVGGEGECVMNKQEKHMRSQSNLIARNSFAVLAAVLACALMTPLCAQTEPTQKAAAQASSKAFDNPQQAADALIQAAESYDVSALLEIFGPGGKDFIASADPVHDKSIAATFVAKAHEKNVIAIDPKNQSRAILSVGNNDWPFPVPLVKEKGKWRFDSKQGRSEILFRRIGANELDAIQICRGFVEAQQEYASEVHDNSGVNQFAQKIISTPGKHDGLYWKNEDGTPGGPIGEAIARAIEEGYTTKASPYHGYYFKVLKGQGPAAPLGQLDYVIEGVMIGGFALVAVPAEYRVTGVKTFMVSYNGVVYEKDLGADSLNIAKNMERYNPDKTWHRTDDEWPTDASAGMD
jgi:DUF2950 family protein